MSGKRNPDDPSASSAVRQLASAVEKITARVLSLCGGGIVSANGARPSMLQDLVQVTARLIVVQHILIQDLGHSRYLLGAM